MAIKTVAYATAAFIIGGIAVNAQADTGVPSSYQQGSGCFSFVMNGVQYSIPDAGLNANPPRSGQAAIDGWKLLLVTIPRGTVTIQVGTQQSAQVCPLQGLDVRDVNSP
jgi:hypothetical protein